MANKTTVQASCTQESHEADEGCENIPPGAASPARMSKVTVQVGDTVEYSQPSQESEPLSNTYTCSTPAPNNGICGVKTKSRLSGLQSALTPILKYLNINNRYQSPEPVKRGNDPRISVPPFSDVIGNSQKSNAGSSQLSSSDFSNGHSGRSSSDTNAPVCWLADECLPEITLLDATCDTTTQLPKNNSPLPDSGPSTPVRAGSVNTCVSAQSSRSHASTNFNTSSQLPDARKTTVDLLQPSVGSPKTKSEATDQTTSVSENTTETCLVINHSSAVKPDGTCDEKDLRSDKHFPQKSSRNAVLREAHTTTFCPHDDAFNRKPPKQCGTITENTTVYKPSPPRVCISKENLSQIHPHESSQYNDRTASKDPNVTMVDIPESIDAPLRWLDDRYFPEITLLEVTRDSEFSAGGEMSSLDVTRDIPSVDAQNNVLPSTPSGQVLAESSTSDMIQIEDLSSTLDGNDTHIISSMSEQSDKVVGENIPKGALEVTRDISVGSVLEDSQPSSEPSTQTMTKFQTSAVDTLGTFPANVTRDLSSSSDMSVQCAASPPSPSDSQCDISPKNVVSVLHDEPVVTSNSVGANNEEPLDSHDADIACRDPQLSPKTAASVNSTFTIVEQSQLRASGNANTTAQMPCPQNKTLDLPPPDPKAQSEANDRATSVSQNSIGTPPVIDQKCSAVNSSGSRGGQNITFDKQSLQRSTDGAILAEACATTCSLQNNTFDKCASQQNDTITVSETSSSDSRHNTSPPKVFNATSSPIESGSEVHSPPQLLKHNGSTTGSDPEANMDTHESTFETNPAKEVASADQCQTKDHSQSGLPTRDGLSYTLGHQCMEMADVQAKPLNLDDTLDLNADALITSTPMTNCKMFSWNVEREEGRNMGAQKKLYGDGPSNPDGQMPSDVPSNACDRKMAHPAPRSLLPPLKAASQWLKYKTASTLAGRLEVTSSLPMTRQRSQAEALRNVAASDAPHMTTGTSAPYNLRATTTESKQPNPGLRKPRMSSIPSGIQRAAPGLKPPSARSNLPASWSAEKHCETTGTHKYEITNPVTKISQARKHPLTWGDALSTAKRKKTDAALPSGNSELPAPSCDAATRAKNLKQPTASQKALPAKTQRAGAAVQASAEASASCNAVSRVRALKQPGSHRTLLPKPQGHGCAKCVILEQQLEMKSEEIRRLKEDLLKYRKPEEES